MIDIINEVKQEFINGGVENVYSAFDAIPVSNKGKIFTVIGMKKFECSMPIYSQYTIYMPYKAELEIKVLAPESSTMEELCNYYETEISGIVNSFTGISSNISGISVKQDKNISKLVLTVNISAGGMKKIQRETGV